MKQSGKEIFTLTQEKDVIEIGEERQAEIQKTVHAFISADILHRRTIEQWANDAGMHRSGHRMLMHLTRCGNTPTQKDLAKHFDISPAAVAVTLKKLESDGYIEREKCASSSDSRYNEIKITERGKEAALASRKFFHHVDSEAFKNFTADELETFTALLERMQENLKNIAPLNFESEQNAKTDTKETEE
jgi:DNA-binding MarR family transcriptional regulator